MTSQPATQEADKLSSERIIILLSNSLLLLLPIITAYIIFVLLSNADKGFDITDEAYYLISASQAASITMSASQFGHYTGLLFSLVDGDIALFRQSGFLILLLLALWFSIAMQNYWLRFTGHQQDRLVEMVRHSVIVIAISNYYCEWIPTPSYNWTTLLSILLVAIALLASTAYKPNTPRQNMHLVLLGVGGALTFLNKPPSAIILAMTAVIWFVLHRKNYRIFSFFIISSITACLALVAHTLIFDRGILTTAHEMMQSATLSGLLQAGHTIPASIDRLFRELLKMPRFLLSNTASIFIFFPLVFWLAQRDSVSDKHKSILITAYSLTLLLTTWFIFLQIKLWTGLNSGAGYLSLYLLSLLLFFLNASENQKTMDTAAAIVKPLLTIYGLLLLATIAFVFGTARGTIAQMSLSAIFPVTAFIYAGAAMDLSRNKRIFVPVTLIFSALSLFSVISVAQLNPYRIVEDLEHQTVPISITGNKSTIYVDPATASYVSELQAIAKAAGWLPGTLLVDMTGASPGASFILDAKTLPTPWLLGGYKGTRGFTLFVLQDIPKNELKHAWILTAPQGRRRNDLSLLNEVGLDFPQGYQETGILLSGHRHEVQILYKPKAAE